MEERLQGSPGIIIMIIIIVTTKSETTVDGNAGAGK